MEKIYVGFTNKVTIICPKCGLKKNKIVFKFKDTHKRLKAKCKCGEVFRFTLDFRKYYRKNVQLAGKYFVQGKDEKEEILIEDISKTGINFTTLKPHNFSKDDLIELKFTLDNAMRMEVRTRVKILWINDRAVGAQFIDPNLLDKDLGLYLIR
ncbi:MAG: PilZ domain-containing protein [Desulfobacterales bacterium]